jgi:hypothetical protein
VPEKDVQGDWLFSSQLLNVSIDFETLVEEFRPLGACCATWPRQIRCLNQINMEDIVMNFKRYWEEIIGSLEEEGFTLYNVDDEGLQAVMLIKWDNTTFRLFIWLDEESKNFNLCWYFLDTVPSNKIHMVLDLLNRLNYGLQWGKFVMHPDNGTLAFRLALPMTAERFSLALFADLLRKGSSVANENHPKFMNMIYGDYTAVEVPEEKKKPQLRLVEKTEEQGELFEEDGV